MKNVFALSVICFLIAFTPISSWAKNKPKTLEKSSRKKPKWVNGLEKDFIIVSSSGETLENAKEKCLVKIKEQIISSVAENVQTESEFKRSETSKNNNYTSEDSFETITKTKAGNIPFIKGVSSNKATAYYWKKVKDNSGIKYYYHIKYPFSDLELKKLILEYNKLDKKLTFQLEQAENSLYSMETIEEQEKLIKEIQLLSKSFYDFDPRKNRARAYISTSKQTLRNTRITVVENKIGQLKIKLENGTNTITTDRKPIIKSNCATINNTSLNGSEWVIDYNYSDCYERSQNSLVVNFNSPYYKNKKEVFFDVTENKVDIFVNNTIYLNGNKLSIPITTNYETGFTIDKIILNLETPFVLENVNKSFQGVGKKDLTHTIEDTDLTSFKSDNISGEIHYTSSHSKEQKVYKMYNQKIETINQ